MNSKRQLIMIDDTYEAEYNERLVNHLKSSSKGNFEFKPYKQMKPAFDEMEKYPFNIILVIIKGSLYQDYYKELNKLKRNKALKYIPITFIYTSSIYRNVLKGRAEDKEGKLEKETIASIGNEFYNPGGIGSHPYEIYFFIKKFWNLNLSPKLPSTTFYFDPCNDDIVFVLIALIISYNKRNILIKEEDIKAFHYLLRNLHPSEKFNDFFDLKSYNSDLEAKYLINFYTSEKAFSQAMNNDFNNNYFSTYISFIKIMYRGLHNKMLKSKFDVPLYFGGSLNENNFQKLKKDLDEKKISLVYSKQFQTFTQIEDIAKKNLLDIKDKKSVPILYELSKLEAQEAYASNIDIGDISCNPNNKEVLFFPYNCFIIEKIEEKKVKIDSKKIEIKIIKLNYLGNYKLLAALEAYPSNIDIGDFSCNPNDDEEVLLSPINFFIIKTIYLGNYSKIINQKQLIVDLNKEKIKQLLENKSINFMKDINERNKNESPIIEENAFIQSLLLEANLIKEKNKPKNIIEIKMEGKGKFIGDYFFNKYNWMLDIYFDDVLQDITINEINEIIPDKIRIEINYPLFDLKMMFCDCYNITEINFVQFETQKVTNMSYLFYNCFSLENLDLSKFKLDNVIDMSVMFYMCKNLKDLNFNLAEKNTNKLEDISYLFRGCYSLKNYDLSNFDLSKIKYNEI